MIFAAENLIVDSRTETRRFGEGRIVLWGALALVCLAAFLALVILYDIDQQVEALTYNYSVRYTARELTNSLSLAEATARGYLLSQDARFLEPYWQAVSEVERWVSALLAIIEVSHDHTGKIRSIGTDITDVLTNMSRTVEMAAVGNSFEAQAMVASDVTAPARLTLENFIEEKTIYLPRR